MGRTTAHRTLIDTPCTLLAQGGGAAPFSSPQKKELKRQLPPDFVMAGAAWGCYPTAASLDALLDWLNPKGVSFPSAWLAAWAFSMSCCVESFKHTFNR